MPAEPPAIAEIAEKGLACDVLFRVPMVAVGRSLVVVAVALVAMVNCGGNVASDGSGGGAGTGGASGSSGAGGGSPGERCGEVICKPGLTCCNSSCGICVAPGEGCPAIDCEDPTPPEPCGDAVCGAGQYCCNASCNQCAAEGEGCFAIACNDCEAQSAFGQGPCDGLFGYAWNGKECLVVGGCSCIGADCNALFPSKDECVAAYAHCPY